MKNPSGIVLTVLIFFVLNSNYVYCQNQFANDKTKTQFTKAFEKAKMFLDLIKQGRYSEAKKFCNYNKKTCKYIDYIINNQFNERAHFEKSWQEYFSRYNIKSKQVNINNGVYTFYDSIEDKGPRGSTEPRVIFIELNKDLEIIDFR